ncbi:MAG: NADP-dependent oxidoreductase, partial [Myxococcota bacterium]
MSEASTNRKVVLAARPDGVPRPEDFRVEEEPLAPLGEGQVRIDVSHLSIDAFIRTTLEPVSFHPSIPIGGTVMALGVGRVRESRFTALPPGTGVFGPLGAQRVATLPGGMLTAVDEKRAPLTASLG